ncbi:MAG: hypothetical protein ABIR51_00310 [Sphingomicrobium sp.]
MRIVRLTLCLAALVPLPAPSIAADPTVEAASVPVAATAKEKVKKVCRRAIETGSIMPRSTCRTQAEWNAMTARSQDALQAARDHAGPTPGAVSN